MFNPSLFDFLLNKESLGIFTSIICNKCNLHNVCCSGAHFSNGLNRKVSYCVWQKDIVFCTASAAYFAFATGIINFRQQLSTVRLFNFIQLLKKWCSFYSLKVPFK